MHRECQQRAQAAMQMAIAAPADERHAWVQVALLWQFFGNTNDADSHEIRSVSAKDRRLLTDADREENARLGM